MLVQLKFLGDRHSGTETVEKAVPSRSAHNASAINALFVMLRILMSCAGKLVVPASCRITC